MGKPDHLNRKGANLGYRSGRNLDQRDIVLVAVLGKLAAKQRQRESTAVDRATEPRPHIGNGTEMILMAVSENQTGKRVAPLFNETEVGKHHIDARHAVVRKGDAEINHQPATVVMVEVGIHPDLAGTAKRHEKKIRRLIHYPSLSSSWRASVLRAKMAKSPFTVRS